MKSVNQLVRESKANGEDYEFYPTTMEIVEKVAKWLCVYKPKSILDIGCGNGTFFDKMERTNYFDENHAYKKYGIEKSYTLAAELPDDVILLGSDFMTNTLIDKKVDCIFCNPPYSEYEAWAEKIILEGNAEKIILVIPARWENSERLKEALGKRKFSHQLLGRFDFAAAERKARATVDVIALSTLYRREQNDPFDLWFDSTFKLNAEVQKTSFYETEEKKKTEIVENGDTAETLVKFYNADMQKLYENYRALEKLDGDIFRELKVDMQMLKESLKQRLQNLKCFYWDLLFKKYERITCRLTTAGRDKVIKRLNDNTAIDFTIENIFQLTMWLIKHSNTLFDEQLTDFFFRLASKDNIHRYKSNRRWNDSDWKYLKEKCFECGSYRPDLAKSTLKNVMLDYRVISEGWSNFDTSWLHPRMQVSCIEFLRDMIVIGENLGFRIDFEIPDKYREVEPSEWSNFDIKTKDGEVFCNCKLYKNGNRHVKFCKSFMKKLNVEMARINGWVHDKQDLKKEMGLTDKEINELWGQNLSIEPSDGTKLLEVI